MITISSMPMIFLAASCCSCLSLLSSPSWCKFLKIIITVSLSHMQTPSFCEKTFQLYENTVQYSTLGQDITFLLRVDSKLRRVRLQSTSSNLSMYRYLFFQSLNFMLESVQLLPQLITSCQYFLKYANIEMCK